MASYKVTLAVRRYIMPESDTFENPEPRQVEIADMARWFNVYFKSRQSNLVVDNVAVEQVNTDYVYGAVDFTVPFSPEMAVVAKWLQESYNLIPVPDFWFIAFEDTTP